MKRRDDEIKLADGRDDVAHASEGMPLLIVDDVIALRAAAKSKR